MRPPRAVIAQTGHSGSGYIAEVLKLSGLKASHEAWFNPFNLYTNGLDVDSAWPSTASLDKFDGIIWHQVREPMKTITSLVYTADWKGPYWAIRKQVMREVTGDRLIDAAIMYVDFNLRAEAYASKRWRVEDVDARLIKSLVKELGYKPKPHAIRAALESTSKRTNHHTSSTPFEWWQFPKHEIVSELKDMTLMYGYEVGK